jgi:hypothetical protein
MTHLAMDEIPLEVALLSPPQIRWRGEPLPLARRQMRGLLFYLAHAPALAPRDRLSFLFWPDLHDGDARAHLKRLLSTLGSALPDGALLSAGHDVVGLDPGRVWCDVEQFQELAAASHPGQQARAVELYRGPFLDGFSLPDCPQYGDWQAHLQPQTELAYLVTRRAAVLWTFCGPWACKVVTINDGDTGSPSRLATLVSGGNHVQ